MPPDNERGRPHQAASAVPTPIKTPPGSVTHRDVTLAPSASERVGATPGITCPRCRETASWCDVDGCPYCHHELHEQKPWIDPCQTCAKYRDEAFWAAVDATPGWRCELENCLTCEVCHRCYRTGEVCRTCKRCTGHEDDGFSPCEETIWSRARRSDVTYYRHTLWDQNTERWGA